MNMTETQRPEPDDIDAAAARFRYLSCQPAAVVDAALADLGVSREQYERDMVMAALFGSVAQKVRVQS